MKRIVILVFVVSTAAFGWGSTGHKIINRNAVIHLPPSMQKFIDQQSFLETHSTDPDTRKNTSDTAMFSEQYRHYLDVDNYPNFHSLSRSFDTLVATYGWSRVKNNGTNPWAIVKWMDSLTALLKNGDWNTAYQVAADLGHYVADPHQPLHACENYDGQQTGNSGIHSRYETTMINNFQSQITITKDSVKYIDDVYGFVFAFILKSNSLTDSIFHADTYAKAQSGGSYNTTYYNALWQRLGDMTKAQFQSATIDLADLWYTAWVNAGLLPKPPSEFFVWSPNISFGNVLIGTNEVDSFYIKNPGASRLTIDSVQTTSTLYAITPSSASIASFDSAKFYISFSPVTADEVKDTALFYDNSDGSPHAIALDGNGVLTAVETRPFEPCEFSLSQNYPNPFNPTTQLRFTIASFEMVTLKVYDILGRLVATLVNERKSPGTYDVQFDGSSLPSGVYFYQLQAGKFSSTKKLMLLR